MTATKPRDNFRNFPGAYTIGGLESRIGGSIFWVLSGLSVDDAGLAIPTSLQPDRGPTQPNLALI